jgi:predicted transposase/invertase (TIGR01784 family)
MGWVSQIDPAAITRIDKSYILQDFSEKEADLVYRLKLKDQEVIFYLLMELQSSVDFQMPYRLLLYMVEIWRDVLKNTDKKEVERKEFRLPSIVPIVLYNGKSRWTAARQFKETLAVAELFRKHVVDFEYILIDINRYEKKTLVALTNLIGAVFQLEQAVSREEYRNRLLGLGPTLKKFTPQKFQMFVTWLKLVSSNNLPEPVKNEIIAILEQSRPEEAEQMVSNMGETLRKMYEDAKTEGLIAGEAKGKEEGKIEGKAEGILEAKLEDAKKMLAKNIPENLIIEITGLSPEQIRQIKESKDTLQ